MAGFQSATTGIELAYRTFDKVRQVDQAAITDNKRLRAVLAMIPRRTASQWATSARSARRSSFQSRLTRRACWDTLFLQLVTGIGGAAHRPACNEPRVRLSNAQCAVVTLSSS
jgi:hypothetical protein